MSKPLLEKSSEKSIEAGPFSQFGENAWYVSELYDLFKVDPNLVGKEWIKFFESNNSGAGYVIQGINGINGINGSNGASAVQANGHLSPAASSSASAAPSASADLQAQATQMIERYRSQGHLLASFNPLKQAANPVYVRAEDELSFPQVESRAGETVAWSGVAGKSSGTVRDLIEKLKAAYSSTIGFEFSHLLRSEERAWLFDKVENRPSSYEFSVNDRLAILQKVMEAELFEAEIHRKFVGAKRFSGQGSDSLLPMLYLMLDRAAQAGVKESVIGMAHRGRLAVLASVLGKPIEAFCREFEDKTWMATSGAGDVKYHNGFNGTVNLLEGRTITASLLSNPSHLEAVNPVVEGVARARQDLEYGAAINCAASNGAASNGAATNSETRKVVLPVLLHGDAAVMGQGVVPETFNMSRLPGYDTGGTVHIVINNQVGFTTDPVDGRSSVYSTEWAKAADAPVFHVNAADIEGAVWVTLLALEFRQKFGRDVMIDLVSFRRYGHNEADEPMYTQPQLYSEIKDLKPYYIDYAEKLVEQSIIGPEKAQVLVQEYKAAFAAAEEKVKKATETPARPEVPAWNYPSKTAVPEKKLKALAAKFGEYPSDFSPHPKLKVQLDKRVDTVTKSGEGIEWGFAELLAYASLFTDGIDIRLTGEDVERGTFSHRHAVLNSVETRKKYSPLGVVAQEHDRLLSIHNSPLSEYAVMGFEFGYSTVAPQTLVLWEAQFGDFANGAQITIDQFIASCEQKWNQLSGLTLLLPHGYEGQGPEHSSARLERFLQLAANNNMRVCYSTTAAQHFHLLRSQGLSEAKRPLIIMTPKSLLRHPGAAATVKELSTGSYAPILITGAAQAPKPKVLLMSGKVYFEVVAAIEAQKRSGEFLLIRVEQLYPFPIADISAALKKSEVSSVRWVQEEPQNFGAYSFAAEELRNSGIEVSYAGRPRYSGVATGSSKWHAKEQAELIAAALK